ncbi:MAG: hypothetical protein ACRCXC_00015 [Legionella sp.]
MGWYVKNWLQLYTEVYGQTRTGPERGPGYILNSGVIFLISQYIALDMEVGQRLSGELGNFNTYYGGGISCMF